MRLAKYGARLLVVIALFVVVRAATSTAASPAQWYASPTGTGSACSQADPCDLPTALASAADGDVVLLASGTYSPPNKSGIDPPEPETFTVATRITVQGEAGALPFIKADSGDGLDISVDGVTLRHLQFQAELGAVDAGEHDLTVDDATISGSGGGITANHLTLTGSDLSGNAAFGVHAGALHMTSSTIEQSGVGAQTNVLTMTDSTVSGCAAGVQTYTATVDKSTFTGNALMGLTANGPATVTNSTFTSNALTSSSPVSGFAGVGVGPGSDLSGLTLEANGIGASLTDGHIADSTFTSNSTGISLVGPTSPTPSNGRVFVTGTMLTKNGFAVFGSSLGRAGNVTVADSHVIGNSSGISGGNITVLRTEVTDNVVSGGGVGLTAALLGNGINGSGTVDVEDSTVSGNNVGVVGGDLTIRHTPITKNLGSGPNTTYAIGAANTLAIYDTEVSDNGGGIYGGVNGGSMELHDSYVLRNGGGIIAGDATLVNTSVTDNGGFGSANIPAFLKNLAVAAEGSVTIEGGEISRNSGGVAAGIATIGAKDVSVTDAHVVDNAGGDASPYGSFAIRCTGDVSIHASVVSGNAGGIASGFGGTNGGGVTVADSYVTGNGGGIIAGVGSTAGGNVDVTNAHVLNNGSSASLGPYGAFAISGGGHVTIDGSEVSGNSGGVIAGLGGTGGADLTVTDSQITKNTTSGDNPNAAYVVSGTGTVRVDGSTVSDGIGGVSGVDVTVQGSSITNNDASAGSNPFPAFAVNGTSSVVVGDSEVSGNGGGIFAGQLGGSSGGDVTVADSHVVDNVKRVSPFGYFAIGSTGSVTVDGGEVSGNGGGISGNAVSIVGVSVLDNKAISTDNPYAALAVRGGAGGVKIDHSTVSGNSGGVVAADTNGTAVASVTVTNSEVTKNAAPTGNPLLGPAIVGGAVTLKSSDVSANAGGVSGLGGPNEISGSTIAGNTVQGTAGASVQFAGDATIERSTISGNSASGQTLSIGGVLATAGHTTVGRSTIANNTAQGGSQSVGGVAAFGDGVSVAVEQSTIVGNKGQTAGGFGGSGVSLTASIVAESSGPDCGSPLVDGGFNIDDDGSCGFSAGAHSMSGSAVLGSSTYGAVLDAYLGVLGDHGGSTLTVPLLASPSPATSIADPAVYAIPRSFLLGDGATAACSTPDQRGVVPPTVVNCAIGAFDYSPLVAPEFTSGASASFMVGKAGSFTVKATGMPTPAVTASGLPSWLVLTDNGDGTAKLAGTPPSSAVGVQHFTLYATNAASPAASQSFTLTVKGIPPKFTSAAKATFTATRSGSFTVTTSGVPAAAITGSGLPAWLVLTDGHDGTTTLAGTPPADSLGDHTFTLSAANGQGPAATQAFTLTVKGIPPKVTSAAKATFIVTQPGSFTVKTSGVPAAAVTDSGLPGWLSLRDNGDGTATLAGTPPADSLGDHAFTLSAANGQGSAASQSFVLTVKGIPPKFTSAAKATFTVGKAGVFTVRTTAAPTATITASGLPAWVTFTDRHDGTATLAATAPSGTVGAHSFTIHAANLVLPDASQSFTLTVVKAASVTHVAAPAAVAYGAPLPITATVGPVGANTLTPGGNVAFSADGIGIGTGPLPAGHASLSFAGLLPGAHTLEGVYGGDTNFGGSHATATVNVTCPTTITGDHGTVVVSSGVVCIINARITGSVVVTGTGTAVVMASTVSNSIADNSGGGLTVCGSTITGSITAQNTRGFVLIGDPTGHKCAPNTVTNAIAAISNHHGATIIGNTYGTSIVATNNTGTGPYPTDTTPHITDNHRQT